ncbi:MAG TPA: SPFH domain-containing protein [Candidatus Paceibacterota bacterium]|nr:SPFH domain-containing protein [Candidatus Paceibacterota bacterium]
MAHHGPDNLIGVGRSTSVGVLKALMVATLPAAVTFHLTDRFPLKWQLASSLVAWGLSYGAVYKAMASNGHVPVGSYGVHTVGGAMSGKIFDAGDHPLIPGLEGVILVSSRDTPIDPPAFEDLARDSVPISFDGYFVVRIHDPVKHLTRIADEDAEEALRKLFEAEIRLFITQWKRGADLIAQRELLKEFLMLSGRKGSTPAEKLRVKLMALTEQNNAPLDQASVDNIMEDAGKFCGYAADWGYEVTEVHTEGVDLPKRLKDAAEKAAAETNEMKTYEIRQARRLAMIKGLKKEMPDLSDRDALVAIDTLLGLSVNRSIFEVDIRGAEKLGEDFGPKAKKIVDAVSKMIPDGKKGA